MIRPEIRPEGPSLFHVLFGMLKIMHLKQFITIALSINILLCLFHIISLKTFFIGLVVCGTILFVLTGIDYLLKKRQANRDEEIIPLLQPEDQWESRTARVRYDLKPFSRVESPDEPEICGVCLHSLPEGTEVAVLPCMHSFHPKCIESWTKVQNECPMCKASII